MHTTAQRPPVNILTAASVAHGILREHHEDGVTHYSVDASDLRWPPGQIPAHVRTTLGSGEPFTLLHRAHNEEREVVGWLYGQHNSRSTLTVFNDQHRSTAAMKIKHHWKPLALQNNADEYALGELMNSAAYDNVSYPSSDIEVLQQQITVLQRTVARLAVLAYCRRPQEALEALELPWSVADDGAPE